MKCSNCFNDIINSSQCKYCPNIFCSLTCLQIHYSNFHHTNNNNDNLKKHTNIKSPFLVTGTLNKSISYDKIYSLENFVPVVEEDGKIKTLGSGSYGQVYLGYNTITNDYYAIKHMDKKTIFSLLHTLGAAKDEIDIQSRIDHPNIIKLLYVKETDISYDLVMEYAPKGNLFHFIRKTKGLTEDLSFLLFMQIVNAINFLHENDLIHRDIKPENILIFENDVVKLCDFGWCVKLAGQQRETFCGTTEYMSPELVKHRLYGKEIDAWSLGILLYEMIHGYSPFRPNKPNFDEKDVMENIINHNLNFDKNVSSECEKLIYGLLDPNIINRYKVEDIYNSEFVKKYEEKQFDFKNNNIFINKNQYQPENQINNIVYSPQIEMNNNINIHMSMDMNNYVYNIQMPDENNKNIDTKDKNQIFQKINKGVYNNYINSINNLGNNNNNNGLINNNYLQKNVNENNNKNINVHNINNNNNNNKQNKLLYNKTWNPPSTIKNEEELANNYSPNINEAFPEDSKRDNNNNIVNFNNSIFYFPGQKEINNILGNNLNLNNNTQLNNINNNQFVQVNGIKKRRGNSMSIIREGNNLINAYNKYYNNDNTNNNIYFNNSNSIENNFNNNHNFYFMQSSPMKRLPSDLINYNFQDSNKKNSIERKYNIKAGNQSEDIDHTKYLYNSDIFFSNETEEKSMNLNKKREPVDNFISRKFMKNDGIMKVKGIYINNNLIYNNTSLLNHRNEGIIKIKPNRLHKKVSSQKDIKTKNKEYKKGISAKYQKINFDQPKETLLKNIELNKKKEYKKSKSFNETDYNNILNVKCNKNKNKKNSMPNVDYSRKIFTEKKNFRNRNNSENNIEFNTQLDKSVSDISCSLFSIINTSRRENNETKINKNKNKNKSHSMVNNIIINDKNNNYLKNSIKKEESKNNNNNNKNEYIEHTPDSKLFKKKINYSNDKNRIKLTKNEYGRQNSDTNIKKYLKINKTADENQLSAENRINVNLDKKGIYDFDQKILDVIINDNDMLKPTFSFNIGDGNEDEINYLINNNDLKNNMVSNSNKYNNKRKLNDKNYIASIKETESNIINNTSDYSDTIDERNPTPKKNQISNRIKPNKLIEAFKKELANNFITIKRNNKK